MHRVRIFEHIRGSADAQHLDENIFITVVRPALVELLGTFFLVTLSIWSGCNVNITAVHGALCGGCTLMCLLACFGHISGTHLNPCVTLGIFIAGEVHAYLAFVYVLMQIIGAIGAAGLLRLLIPKIDYLKCRGGVTVLNDEIPIDCWQGIIIEMIITYMLVTVILLVALDTKSKTGLASLLIGFTLIGNILAAGSYTGASMNPARSLGPAIVAHHWNDHWVYWVGPLLGAGLAGVMYRLVWAHHDRRWPKIKVKKINEIPVPLSPSSPVD